MSTGQGSCAFALMVKNAIATKRVNFIGQMIAQNAALGRLAHATRNLKLLSGEFRCKRLRVGWCGANIKQLTKGLFLRLLVILCAGNILEGKGSLRPTRQLREGNHRLQGALDRASEIPDPHILHSECKGQI